MRPTRIDALWLLALLALVCAPFWVPRPQSGYAGNSLSTDASGKLAFYRLLESATGRYSGQVFRNHEPLERLLEDWSSWSYVSPVLCLPGTARLPTIKEWNSILPWVAAGGRLVLAVPEDAPEFSQAGIPLRVTAATGVSVGPDEARQRLKTILAEPAELLWISRGQIQLEAEATGTERLVQLDDSLQAVRVAYGLGDVTVLASDFLLTNQALAFGDQGMAELAWLVLGAEESDRDIVVDESLNSTGVPRVVGLLLVDPLRPVTLQLLLVVLIFAWRGSRRSGPAMPAAVPPRRNITDHTDAVGQMQYRTRNGAPLLREYLQQLLTTWRLPASTEGESPGLNAIAARAGISVESLQAVLTAAESASREKWLSRRSAAAHITELARLRRATVPDRA